LTGARLGMMATMPANNPTPDVIAVWSDISCPWSTLALRTLHERAADRGIAPWIDHRSFPLQPVNAPIPKPAQDFEMTETTATCRQSGPQ
jgi:predicted DsbA family dithiol-disulfide isomerase